METPDASVPPQDAGRVWLSEKLQALRDTLVPPDVDASAIDEVTVPMLGTLAAGQNALMLFMAKQEQSSNLSLFVAAIARATLGVAVGIVSLESTTTAADFTDRLFARTGSFSPVRDSIDGGLPPSPVSPGQLGLGSMDLRNQNSKGSPGSRSGSVAFDKLPPSPRRAQASSGSRPSLVPGMSRKYSMGIAAGRKLPGVLILENLQQASKDVQFLVSDMLVKKQVGSHNLPRPFILVAMVPSSASYRKSLPQHLIDLFFLSNSLETVVPRTLPVPDSRTGPLVTQEELDTLVTKAEQMTFDGDLERYVWDLVTSARQHPLVFTPPTSRARTDLVMASKAVAALFGASFATTAHVQLVFDKALAHRIALTSSRNPAGGDRSAGKGAVVPSPSDVCNDCLDSVPTPL